MIVNAEHEYGLILAVYDWFLAQDGPREALEVLELNLLAACERYFVPTPLPTVLEPQVADGPWGEQCSATPCDRNALVLIITRPARRTYACAKHAEWLLAVLEGK